jgi:hypothetical protein
VDKTQVFWGDFVQDIPFAGDSGRSLVAFVGDWLILHLIQD